MKTPAKTLTPLATKKKFLGLNILAFGLCFLAMFGIAAVEFDNIVSDTGFFILFSSLGLIISLSFVTTLLKLLPGFKTYEKETNYIITSLVVIGLTLITVEAAAFINAKFSSASACSDFIVERKSSGGNRTRAFWLFIRVNDSEERIELNKATWDKYSEGNTINVCIASGVLGFEVMSVSESL